MDKMLTTLKDLMVSRTIWGMLILLANSAFGKHLDMSLTDQGPAVFEGLFNAIGAVLVVIGRIMAKPTPLAPTA